MFWGFLRWRSWQLLMNNVKLYVYNFLSVLFSIHIRDDIVWHSSRGFLSSSPKQCEADNRKTIGGLNLELCMLETPYDWIPVMNNLIDGRKKHHLHPSHHPSPITLTHHPHPSLSPTTLTHHSYHHPSHPHHPHPSLSPTPSPITLTHHPHPSLLPITLTSPITHHPHPPPQLQKTHDITCLVCTKNLSRNRTSVLVDLLSD